MTTSTKVAKAIIDTIDNGQIFSVVFEKKDGSLRHMNCRKGVKKYLKGGEATYNGKAGDKNNVGVYDLVTGGYRSFNLDRLKEIRVAGHTYSIS